MSADEMKEGQENGVEKNVRQPVVDAAPVKEEKPESSDAAEDALEEKKEEDGEKSVEPVAVDLSDVKRAGVKSAAVNPDAISIAKKKKAEGEESNLPKVPSFFVDPEKRHIVRVDVLYGDGGKILTVSRSGLGIDFSGLEFLGRTEESFEFTMPSYDKMTSYRKRCTVYHQVRTPLGEQGLQMVVDKLELRNFFLVWHLKDWSLRDRDGEKVPLSHDKDGSLTTECMDSVYSLHPTLVDVVLTTFESDMLLT